MLLQDLLQRCVVDVHVLLEVEVLLACGHTAKGKECVAQLQERSDRESSRNKTPVRRMGHAACECTTATRQTSATAGVGRHHWQQCRQASSAAAGAAAEAAAGAAAAATL